MGLALPCRVQGYDPDGGEWHEMTTTREASYGGACLTLRHPHSVGQVVLLSLPLPRSFRRYSLVDSSYRTYALIRSTRAIAGGRDVGLMFLGRNPPRGFRENPGGRYLVEGDIAAAAPGERRRHTRVQAFVNLHVARSAAGSDEQTVTENISRGGARVMTTLPVQVGESLIVSDLAGTVRTTAVVRNVFAGPDRITRLNLEFEEPPRFEQLLAAAGGPRLPAEDDEER